MSNDKYTIGSQWKTREGKRVVIVDITNSSLWVWRKTVHDCETVLYRTDGTSTTNIEHDLIEPWVEPKVIKGWTLIFENNFTKDDYFCSTIYGSEKSAHIAASAITNNKVVAIVPIDTIEGEGLNE